LLLPFKTIIIIYVETIAETGKQHKGFITKERKVITTITQFQDYWKQEADGTRKIMAELTDTSLLQRIAENHRTLGHLAWHITTCIPEMLQLTGLKFDSFNHEAPVPKTADEIKNTYDLAAGIALEQVIKNWTDATLQVVDDMYGMKWPRGLTLRILIDHEIHHRLKVPGLMGPSLEECIQYGMKPPEV
jgi:uncharacterized damage-inducible protein DinB